VSECNACCKRRSEPERLSHRRQTSLRTPGGVFNPNNGSTHLSSAVVTRYELRFREPRLSFDCDKLHLRGKDRAGCEVSVDSEPGGQFSKVGRIRAVDSNQLHPLQARMAVLADDDVVVHGNAERGGDLDDRLGHMDIGLRRRRIAGGVVVHQQTQIEIS